MKPCPNFASIAKFLATQLTTVLRPLKPGSRAPRELRTLSDVEVLMIVWSLLWKILWGMEKEKVCFRSSIWTQCKPRIMSWLKVVKLSGKGERVIRITDLIVGACLELMMLGRELVLKRVRKFLSGIL
jgi:hypothetical protein